MFIDTHCHLDFPEFDQDRDEVIKRSRQEGIDFIVNVGSSLKSSLASLELSKKYDFIYAAVGIHPHEADRFNLQEEKTLRELAQKDKVVAIGEIGLDYYRNFSKAENQKPLFLALLKLAKDFNLPLVIHSREAESDTLKILKEMLPLKVVVHCFSGNAPFLKSCLDLGFFDSFTCHVTYPAKLSNSERDPARSNILWQDKKARDLREIVKLVPLERIFLETDAPYLSPEGLRGRRNEPINVKFVAEEIAKAKSLSLEEVSRATSNNAKGFFNLG